MSEIMVIGTPQPGLSAAGRLGMGPVASVPQLPRDTDRVLNGLGEAFSDLELQTAGVAVRNDHDQLAFCPENPYRSAFVPGPPDDSRFDAARSTHPLRMSP